MAGRQSAEVRRALRLIIDKGWTAYAAAKKTGISQSTISRNPQYRAFIDAKKKAGGVK